MHANGAEVVDPTAGGEPRPARLLTETGYFHLAAGDLDSASAAFGAAIVVAPEEPVPYLGLGEAALAREDADEALHRFQQALGLVEDDRVTAALVHLRLGDAHLARQDAAETRASWTRARHLGLGSDVEIVARHRLDGLSGGNPRLS